MNLLHKNKNDDDNNIENEEEEKPNKMILYSVIYLSSFLTPNLQFNASSKKKNPSTHKRVVTNQPLLKLSWKKKWRTKHKTQPPPLHIIYVTNNQRVVGKLEEKAKCKNKERSKSSGHKEGGGIGWRTWGRCLSSWNPSCYHRQHGNHQNQEKLHLWCLHCSKIFFFFCCCCKFWWEKVF